MSVRFVFGPFEFDPDRHRLMRAAEPIAASDRHLDVLALLVARAGQIVAKDDLVQAGWKDVAVSDNSLEQAISGLRRLLGTQADGTPFIETVPRRGYRFTAAVARTAPRESDDRLDALLAPHRAFLEGRAALETLEAGGVVQARRVFEDALHAAPEYGSAHIGLANACVMQFEMTRADPAPDRAALQLAIDHAREACRLAPQSGEAWATLGFVLDRTGDRRDAPAAVRRAVALDPDNWRHHFRLAFVSWGEERLGAAHRALALLPHFPLAHWLAATVHVARQSFDEAERELTAGLEAGTATSLARFNSVALHWLMGLLRLARGDEEAALDCFERELAAADGGQLYARECAANTWYAIGVIRLGQGRSSDATAAFVEATTRVTAHPLATVALAAAGRPPSRATHERQSAASSRSAVDVAMVLAAAAALLGRHAEAAALLDSALAEAPPGNAGWLIPIEPLLNPSARPDAWSRVLARLKNRAA